MKISRAQLKAAADIYCKMPTQKRDVPSKSLKDSARKAMTEFLLKYPDDETFPTGPDLLLLVKQWLIESDYSRNLKSTHARRMAAILREQYYIEPEEATELSKRFAFSKPIKWSDKALSQSQLEELFVAMDATLVNPNKLRYYMAICVMLFTGARITSALSAKNPVINNDEIGFDIPRLKSKVIEDIHKSIPLGITMPNGKGFRKIATDYMTQRKRMSKPSAYLFPSNRGGRANELSVRQYIKALNISFTFTPHCLRHTAGTLTAERAGVLEATRLLDHTSLATTQHYIKRDSTESKSSISKVWDATSAPLVASAKHNTPPELQETLIQFNKDAARLSELVKSFAS